MAIAAAGFECVEIFEADVLAHESSPKEIGAEVRDHGLETVAFLRMYARPPTLARLRAGEAQVPVDDRPRTTRILVCSNVSPLSLGIDRGAADLRELGEVAHGFGIEVGCEALAWGRHVSDDRDAEEIVRRADHPSVVSSSTAGTRWRGTLPAIRSVRFRPAG